MLAIDLDYDFLLYAGEVGLSRLSSRARSTFLLTPLS